MELRHQRNSVAVARSCISPRAAKRLGIKQPALSLQIHQVEREMGKPLFRRETRGVKITESGALLPESSLKNPQAIEQIHGLGENRRCNLQGFEAAICSSLQSLRSRERPAASVDGLQRQSDSVPFSVRFHIVPKIRCFPT